MTEPKTRVSIICPAFQEQEVLPHFHRELSAVLAPLESVYEFEVLYIDDGSRDNTLAAMKTLATLDARVRVLSLARNFGKEAALQAGLEHAGGELIITMDTDLQHPPEVIPLLLEKAREPVDLVITVRQEYQKPGWLNQLGTQAFYRVLHSLSEIEIRRETSDFLLMTRKVADVLMRMQEKHRFMKGLVHWMGFAYLEVPFRPNDRALGQTKFSFRQLITLGKDCLFSFSKKPLTLATTFGIITLCVGLIWALAALLHFILQPGEFRLTEHYLIVSSHVLAGAILVTIGILGEYLGRIWEQVRSRPNYLLKYDSESKGNAERADWKPHHAAFAARNGLAPPGECDESRAR
ncbi:MAG: glycosyltransferase family 2 protein [Planctomycetes bacterium]|nr:glycosyltransferase family 2 protein [Planctomycetota bacterium]